LIQGTNLPSPVFVHGAGAETLVKNADAAMYCAKDSGRNAFRFFTEQMNAEVLERMTLESGMRLALDNEELFLVYQPQMEVATCKMVGLEALLRWRHPDLGLVPSDRFIRVARGGETPVRVSHRRTSVRKAPLSTDAGARGAAHSRAVRPQL
jgi:predicted signal transduction protein with EAL and GGDEF domain